MKLAGKDLLELKKQMAKPKPKCSKFYCVICRCFREGSARASFEMGRWYCWHHSFSLPENLPEPIVAIERTSNDNS